MELLEQRPDGIYGTSAAVLTPRDLRCVTPPLAARILTLLAHAPRGMHAAAIARQLKQDEQKIHYHVRKLRKAGVLTLDRVEEGSGAAAKILRTSAGAYCLQIDTPTRVPGALRGRAEGELAPFIENGRWNARIIVGSPDPHGPEGARGKDAAHAVDLALFFGLFLAAAPEDAVVLDTELQHWDQNLIIIGGPVVNKAAERVSSALPAQYDYERKQFVSKVSGKTYASEHIGIIARSRNPYRKEREILLIAGKRSAGTRAAILALMRELPAVMQRLRASGLLVIEGIDANSDGSIDSYRILE